MIWRRIKAKLRGARKSLTIQVNSLAAAVMLGLPALQENLPQLQAYLPDDVFRYLMGAVIVLNLLLRFKTAKGLEEK